METINIIDLIEKNPITNFTAQSNNKLIDKIKKTFNQDDQKIFIANFYSYLNHDQEKDFIIDLDDIWSWLGFSQKSNCKRLLEKNFILNKDYKIIVDHNNIQKKEGRGGHNKEKIVLTPLTFKKICLKADTKKANDIYDYYIKLQDIIFETIMELNDEFSNELKKFNKEYSDITTKNEKYNHDLMLEIFGCPNKGPLIYICRVKSYEDNSYLIKIIDCQQGIEKIKTNKFDEYVILNCFPVFKNKDFKDFLYTHPEILPCKIGNDKVSKKDNNVFLIGKSLSFNRLIQIIDQNKQKYSYVGSPEEKEYLEKVELIKKLKTENEYLKFINNI